MGPLITYPRTLASIWGEADTVTFRVRNIFTLDDYLLTSIVSWKHGRPEHMTAYRCDEWFLRQQRLDCGEALYALLSTRAEIDWMKRQIPATRRLVIVTKKAYGNLIGS